MRSNFSTELFLALGRPAEVIVGLPNPFGPPVTSPHPKEGTCPSIPMVPLGHPPNPNPRKHLLRLQSSTQSEYWVAAPDIIPSPIIKPILASVWRAGLLRTFRSPWRKCWQGHHCGLNLVIVLVDLGQPTSSMVLGVNLFWAFLMGTHFWICWDLLLSNCYSSGYSFATLQQPTEGQQLLQ